MITININKAKAIAHDVRRVAREKEFAPYDALIIKQIPGTDVAAVDALRQEIRDKYAEMQLQIDAAQTPEEIKAVLPNQP
jgi:Zn-dependent M32 family carboxypeptidase